MIMRCGDSVPNYEVLNLIGWDSFEKIYKKQITCLTFRLYKDDLPGKISVWKGEPKNNRTLRNNHRVRLPSFKKFSYKKSFGYRSAVIWNQLSNKCVEINTLNSFKLQLKNEIESIAFIDGAIRQKNDNFIYY